MMAQRYDIWIYYETMETDKDDNGDWVKYDDHAAEITQLRAELEQALHAEGMYRRKNHALTEELAAERKLSSYLNDANRRNK